MSYLLSLLSEVSCPVLVVGKMGCGKTALVRKHFDNACSGEASDMQFLSVNTNHCTIGKTLWNQINVCLEWKSGRTYVPRGNKKLLCLIDDLHTAKVWRCLLVLQQGVCDL